MNLMPWHFRFKPNKDKNPSSSSENAVEMKIREYDPQTPPSPVNIPSLILYAPHNLLVKETQGCHSSPVCPLSLWEHIFYYINVCFTFLTSLFCSWILLWWRKNLKFIGSRYKINLSYFLRRLRLLHVKVSSTSQKKVSWVNSGGVCLHM